VNVAQVRLAAHHPDNFKDHTHLVIDEVHERSVDGDLLCMFAKKLLDAYPKLKLILMSATVHTELYKEYVPLCFVCVAICHDVLSRSVTLDHTSRHDWRFSA
jgi:HrpA-like RNA helicase